MRPALLRLSVLLLTLTLVAKAQQPAAPPAAAPAQAAGQAPGQTAASQPDPPPTTPLSPIQPTTAADAPQRDTSYIDANGTAHITRIVRIPDDLSPQAQHFLARKVPDVGPITPLAESRPATDKFNFNEGKEWQKLYPATITEDKVADVPVHTVVPANLKKSLDQDVLLCIHGGGFNSDSGSYVESIPIAGLTGIKVVAVLYRLAPENPFPAAVDDSIAVYKELLKTHSPKHIAIYGTSAGAILTGEVAVRLKQLNLPMPAALGIFSGLADFARLGDSFSFFNLSGLAGHLDIPPAPGSKPRDLGYVGTTDTRDPVLSPMYADLHGMPPTLFLTSSRDMLLSGTINLHRAFLNAGDDASLIVYDGLPHAFWYSHLLPEAMETNQAIAAFLLKHLEK